jgi:hypothetical protein
VQHSETIELRGVPTVAIVTESFADQCNSVKYVSGFPNQRLYFTVHPITGTSYEQCLEYIRGNDPVSGRPLFDEIVEGLTVPMDGDQDTGILEFPRAETVGPDTADNIEQLFANNKFTDYLPIHLPTVSAVNAMLLGTSHNRDEVVGSMRSTGYWRRREFTVENVASAAVIAGCKPEYMPVCLAIAGTGSCHTSTSTTSFSSMVVVNGPIRNEINMNYMSGAMGPYNHANATIGRFWTIHSKCQTNIGHAGNAYMGVYGTTENYNNMCFPENEEMMPPGWNPLHVQRGFGADESAVTTFSGWRGGRPDISMEFEKLGQLPWWLGNKCPFYAWTFILGPDVAWALYEESGADSKEFVSDYCAENATITNYEYMHYSYHVQNFGYPDMDTRQPFYDNPEGLHHYLTRGLTIIVTGYRGNQFMESQGQGPRRTASIDEWR